MTADGLLRDAAIGETREALVRDGRIQALRVTRWSDEGRRARWGERYVGRVRRVEARLRGAFVDLGLTGEEGFLRCDGAGRTALGGALRPVIEGQSMEVEIRREGARDKGPVLGLVGDAAGAPRRLAIAERDAAPGEPLDAETRDLIDAVIEGATARAASITGGGRLVIEPTAALVAVDVDAGGRTGVQDPERFALDLNCAAADEIARQARLRALGGLFAIDFVAMRRRESATALGQRLRAAFAGDPWGVTIAPLSRFGVVELSRAQLERPLHEILFDDAGAPTAETDALACLRAMEREAAHARGRVVSARLAPRVRAWLEGEHIPWRAALNGRIGPRWELATGDAGRSWEVALV